MQIYHHLIIYQTPYGGVSEIGTAFTTDPQCYAIRTKSAGWIRTTIIIRPKVIDILLSVWISLIPDFSPPRPPEACVAGDLPAERLCEGVRGVRSPLPAPVR